MAPSRRSILITGCSAGGIGSAIAFEYQRRGYHVLASARNPSKISSELVDLPNITPITLDVCSQQSIDAAVKEVAAATGGKLDILFNNAGSSVTCPALDTALDEARQQVELHLIAPLACTQAFFPLLIRGRNAVVVNNSSIAGETNLPFQAIYGASKSATATFSETLRLEIEPLGIRVVTVITGIIETNLHSNEKEQKLSEESFYAPLNQWLRDRKAGTNRPPGMAVEQYAKQCVAKIENGAKGKIYVGPLTPLFVYLQWWCPQWIWDIFMVKAGPENQNELIAKEYKRKAPSEVRTL